MDPSVLTVYSSPLPKVRIGRDNDGGYIVADIPNVKYSILLAGGVANDISFEEDFLKRYDTKCIALDGTVTSTPAEHPKIQFVKKNIGYDNNDNMTNLHDIINENENIFVKMDIEGWEIPWIQSLSEEHMNKFEQIVMEFHHPFSFREVPAFDKLNKTHVLVHFHPNNCCGTRNHNGVDIPNVFECTYLHKKYFDSPPTLNKDPIPGPLDMMNVTYHEEIYLNHPPFVF
jgi:hypothetical protein